MALLALLAVTGVLAGCSTTDSGANPLPPSTAASGPGGPAGATPDPGYSILRVGDLIMISYSDIDHPPPKQDVNIPDGGIITLPFNRQVKAEGKTTTQLEKDIRDAYVPSLFVNLTVSVRADQRFYYVDGEVHQPKAWAYFGETTVLRAIANAGGFTEFAKRSKIELRRQNGQRFFINYNKALKDPKLDLPVFPNDHIIVNKGWF